jgi:hypothetical protein
MGQLADRVRVELSDEFFKNNRILFFTRPREYCRRCKQYVENNARERLVSYKREIGKNEDLNSSDFL